MIRKANWKTMMLLAGLLALPAMGCRVQQTQEGKVPEVDVSAKGGQMPKYDVDAPKVDVHTEKREVTVPTVEVHPPADDNNNGKKPPQ
jgi:hypothetical protein